MSNTNYSSFTLRLDPRSPEQFEKELSEIKEDIFGQIKDNFVSSGFEITEEKDVDIGSYQEFNFNFIR